MENPISCSTVSYAQNGFSLDRALEGISEAGYKYVELASVALEGEDFDHIHPERKDALGMAKLKEQIRDYGLEVTGISGHCDIMKKDGLGIKQLRDRINLASYLDAKFVNTGTGEPSSPSNLKKFYEDMIDIISYCNEKDVKIALEPHGELTSTGVKLAEIVRIINSERIGINYDPANIIYFDGSRPEDEIEMVAPRIIHLHVKDHRGGKGNYDFPPLGHGDIDFKKIFSVLKSVGYENPITFEDEGTGPGCFSAPEQIDADVKIALKYLRNNW